ncbi:MAG: hypothetical protein JNJ74_05055, partial [Xanthomonadales bacterium]|nr:hypothetical protein [Xanthomonadales bacterium]
MNPPDPRPAATDAGLSRQFWPLQAAGWLGYIAFSYIVAIGHGKPNDYWKVIVPVAASGFLATSALRYVLRALWRQPAPVFLASAVVPVLLCAAV